MVNSLYNITNILIIHPKSTSIIPLHPDSDKITDVYAEVPSILGRSNRATSASGISDAMPLEHTRYSVDTTDITVTRQALEEEWGARFVGE